MTRLPDIYFANIRDAVEELKKPEVTAEGRAYWADYIQEQADLMRGWFTSTGLGASEAGEASAVRPSARS
jgi:isoleucyl-tRNA synthetase